MTHNHSGIPFHNFIVGGKSIEGALPLRPSKDKAMSRLSGTRLARWALQTNTILREAFFRKSRERTHCGKRGQHRARTEKKALCGRATWHGVRTEGPPPCHFHRLTLLVNLSLAQSEFFLRQRGREDGVNLIKSLNLLHILTYEGTL